MLLARVITALVLIPLTLLILYFLPPIPFLFVTLIVTLYAAWEWAGLMRFDKKIKKFAYVVFVLAACGAVFMANALHYLTTPILFAAAFIWWLMAFILVAVYPRFSEFWGRNGVWQGLMGVFVLVPFWCAFNFIRQGGRRDGFFALLFLLVLIWAADSAAFFAGRRWGKHKLAPQVSPGKTWEGCLGALISTIIIPVIAFWLTNLPYEFWWKGILLSIVVIFFSVVGDLFESIMKRNAGVKDSGNILPGHGGVLDRIDSLTSAAPVFAFGALLITHQF